MGELESFSRCLAISVGIAYHLKTALLTIVIILLFLTPPPELKVPVETAAKHVETFLILKCAIIYYVDNRTNDSFP